MTSVVSNRWHEVIKAVLSSNVTQLTWKCELHPLISSMNTWSKCTARDIDKVVADRIVFFAFLYFCIFPFLYFCIFLYSFFLFRQGGCWADGRYQLSQTLKYLEISYERAHMTNWHLSFNTCLSGGSHWDKVLPEKYSPVCLDIFCGVVPELSTGCRSDTFCRQNKTNCMIFDFIFWMTEVH